MKKRLATICLCLLLSVYGYSQSVLIDNKGDTLVAITIKQVDDIYIELLQKDSLLEQSKISRSKELKYIQLIDSTKKDVNLLKTQLNSLSERYDAVLTSNQKQKHKLKRNKKYLIVAVGTILIQLLIGV